MVHRRLRHRQHARGIERKRVIIGHHPCEAGGQGAAIRAQGSRGQALLAVLVHLQDAPLPGDAPGHGLVELGGDAMGQASSIAVREAAQAGDQHAVEVDLARHAHPTEYDQLTFPVPLTGVPHGPQECVGRC